MHPLYNQANRLTREVIGAGIEVHRALGPGLLERIYERCLMHELELRGHSVVRQQPIVIFAQIEQIDRPVTRSSRLSLSRDVGLY